MKLPSEDFLLPVERFNLAVGPLFAEFKHRFPLDKHTKNSLNHSLGLFLSMCYRRAIEELEVLRPSNLSREEWLVATPEEKAVRMHWQRNLKYLKQRMTYLTGLLEHKKRVEDDDDPF